MHHGISEQQWFDYLELTIEASARRPIDAHLRGCAPCRALLDDIRAWESQVREEASRLAAAVDCPAPEIDRLLAEVLNRIHAGQPAALSSGGRWSCSEAVLLLRALLDPICGAGASRNAISLAASQSCPPEQPRVAAGNWPLFVSNLSSAIAAVYGSATGLLVRRAGACLALEVC
ncbi:MAG: hypothetical protein HY858_12025 [Candidatus Solibacter usitatus]|nr:hypothetical protein [Candidatus Solibacter usitatus]